MTATVVTEHWQIRPNAEWVVIKERQVEVRVTQKRVYVDAGAWRGKVFDRETGREITRRELRIGSLYRHTLKLSKMGGE